MMIWTTNQIIGAIILLFVAFFLGYIRGRISERRSLREYILSSILKEMHDIDAMEKGHHEVESNE